MQTLAERLVWARNRASLSQQQLADAIGAAQSMIGNLESGTRKSSGKMAALAAVLKVDALWLAEGRGEPEADGSVLEGVTEAAPSKATAKILSILQGRSEDEIARIAGALDVLLHAGKAASVEAPEEFRLTGGNAVTARRRKA